MTQVLLATVVLLAQGKATRYDENIMQEVVANRLEYGQIEIEPGVKGYVGLLGYKDIGRLVWLEHEGRIDGPYQVADCAARQDRDRLKALGWAVDLSWELALEWGVVDGPVDGFKVWDRDPRVEMREPFRKCE